MFYTFTIFYWFSEKNCIFTQVLHAQIHSTNTYSTKWRQNADELATHPRFSQSDKLK